MAKVTVISMTKGPVGITVPEVNFKHTWLNKGAKFDIDKEVLTQIMYDPGVEYMLKTGMLYIEDMEAKKEIGLEPEDAEEPVNIIVLSDKDMERYLGPMPIFDFKEKVAALSYEQVLSLADYAIEHRLTNIDKCNIIQQRCGRDIINAIKLEDAAKEA